MILRDHCNVHHQNVDVTLLIDYPLSTHPQMTQPQMRQALMREPQMRQPQMREPHQKKKEAQTRNPKNQGVDDEDVGVNEECMYSDTDSLAALSDSSYDTDMAASS